MKVERIQFERSGGFANIRFGADVELSAVSDEQANAIGALVDDLKFAELPEKSMGASPIADGFVYTITVQADTWKRTITIDETSADDRMNKLIEILSDIAREQRAKK